jgi:hypothetical protein
MIVANRFSRPYFVTIPLKFALNYKLVDGQPADINFTR